MYTDLIQALFLLSLTMVQPLLRLLWGREAWSQELPETPVSLTPFCSQTCLVHFDALFLVEVFIMITTWSLLLTMKQAQPGEIWDYWRWYPLGFALRSPSVNSQFMIWLIYEIHYDPDENEFSFMSGSSRLLREFFQVAGTLDFLIRDRFLNKKICVILNVYISVKLL